MNATPTMIPPPTAGPSFVPTAVPVASISPRPRRPGAGERVQLSGIRWKTYRRLSRALSRNPGVRLTYDRGNLEIMTLGFSHENQKGTLNRLIGALSEEDGIPIASGGSTTLRVRKLRRGLEPDECYWIQNEAAIRGKDKIDLRRDPPPDLVIEVDVSSSSTSRVEIYRTLGVPEVWTCDDQTLTILNLDANGQYAPVARSRWFPRVSADDVLRFLNLRRTIDQTTLVLQFRAWLKTPTSP